MFTENRFENEKKYKFPQVPVSRDEIFQNLKRFIQTNRLEIFNQIEISLNQYFLFVHSLPLFVIDQLRGLAIAVSMQFNS